MLKLGLKEVDNGLQFLFQTRRSVTSAVDLQFDLSLQILKALDV